MLDKSYESITKKELKQIRKKNKKRDKEEEKIKKKSRIYIKCKDHDKCEQSCIYQYYVEAKSNIDNCLHYRFINRLPFYIVNSLMIFLILIIFSALQTCSNGESSIAKVLTVSIAALFLNASLLYHSYKTYLIDSFTVLGISLNIFYLLIFSCSNIRCINPNSINAIHTVSLIIVFAYAIATIIWIILFLSKQLRKENEEICESFRG
jgi:hypothetical protein